MKTGIKTPVIPRWWAPFSGVLLATGLCITMLFVLSQSGCQEEVPGIVNVCIPPTVIRTSPSNADTNVSFNRVPVTRVKSGVAAARVITATFSTHMDPNSITTSTFLVRQGTTPVPGLVSYSSGDSTAVFVAPNGLGPDLEYTCTITTGARDAVAGTPLAANYVWTFTTIAIGTPTLVSPANGAVQQTTNPTLVWNVVPGADTYRLQVSLSPDFSSLLINDSTITTTSRQISGLLIGTTYYWRVNSKISGGTSAYSTAWSFTTITAPAPPVLISPAAGATNVSTSPTLIWNASTGAATYRLQVDTSAAFANVLFDDSTITGTSRQISGLAVGTVYYWRVSAKNVAGTSAYSTVRSFTTIVPPAAPVLITPLNGAVNQSTSPSLIWNSVPGAATYRLQVSLTPGFVTTAYDDSNLTNTAQSVPGLAAGTTYYWRVNAKNAAGTGAYSTVWSFTTIVPPGAPVLITPLNGAVNQSTSPSLIWNSVPGAATYRLQVSLSPGFVSTAYDDSNLTNTAQLVTGLTVGTTYYWRVNAKNAAGTGAYSTVWSFTTIAPPAPPVLVSPVAAAQNQPTSLTFTWLASIGASTYRLQVSTSAVFATTVFNDSTITGTSQPITGLLTGTTYYWRVNAKNAAGTSSYSTRTFTTIVGGLLPPVLVAPANASINVSTSPTLSWNASTGATSYRLQVDSSSLFASPVFDDSTITGLSQPLTNLTNGTTYYWRVNAKNSGGTSGYSTVWQFTVAPSIPTVDLGTAERFGAIGGNAGITNQGIFTQVFGNLGTTAASTLVTGFHDGTAPPFNVFTETTLNIGAVRDTIYTATAPPGSVPGAVANQSLADAQTAFNYLAGLPAGSDQGAGELGGLTLAPGTYTSASGTFAITLLDLTLDAQGDPNALFIFQAASSLTVGAAGPGGARSVLLINGAEAKNVFWVVGTGGSGSATINGAGGGTMVGTIIAHSGVTFSTADNTAITRLEGRALSLVSSVTMVNTIINVPQP